MNEVDKEEACCCCDLDDEEACCCCDLDDEEACCCCGGGGSGVDVFFGACTLTGFSDKGRVVFKCSKCLVSSLSTCEINRTVGAGAC